MPSVQTARPDAPASLVVLVIRCLAKEPSARFQRMADVSRELRGVLGSLDSVPLAAPAPADTPQGNQKRTVADTPAAFQAAQRTAVAGKRRFPRAPYTTPAELK